LRAASSTRTLWPRSEAFIVQPSEGRRLDLGGFEAVVLATSAQTSGDFSLLRTQNEPTGFSPPLHVHRDAAEAFYVLEGDYLVHIEDRQQLCPPAGTVTPELLGTVAARHQMDVLGPVPDTYL
jgi:hypothetical protein